MFYKIMLFILISIFIYLIYNRKNTTIHETKRHTYYDPEPYFYSNKSSNHSIYENFSNNTDEKTDDSNINTEEVINTQTNIYKAFNNTECKNDYCCDDGMTFSPELGVCIKNNDNSYLNEFNVFGVTPTKGFSPKELDKIYKNFDFKLN